MASASLQRPDDLDVLAALQQRRGPGRARRHRAVDRDRDPAAVRIDADRLEDVDHAGAGERPLFAVDANFCRHAVTSPGTVMLKRSSAKPRATSGMAPVTTRSRIAS